MHTLDRVTLTPDDRVRLHRHLTLLRRDEHDVQLGFDSGDATVLADPGGAVSAVLGLMDGRYRLAELIGLGDQLGVCAGQLTSLVARLGEAGLLQPPRRTGVEAYGVRLVGLGPVGTRIGEQLLSAGVGRLVVVDPDAAGQWRGGWASGRDRVQLAEHWAEPDISSVDLTVVVSSSLEVDRAVTAGLTQADHPHLLVRPRWAGAVVGPLVVPGQTSCLRCSDIVRTRADQAWPRMLAQLCRTPGRWDPVAADWAAALTTTQILGRLAGRTVESAAATLELGPIAWSWQRRVWPADPACGCCWSPRAEW